MAFSPKAATERSTAAQKVRPAMQWQDERIRFFSHKHKQILSVDFSGCSATVVEKIARAVPDYVTAQPLASVRILVDFTRASIDREAMRTMKESAVFDKPHIRRSAWIGVEDFPQQFYRELKDFARRELPVFNTRADAIDWLVAD